MHKVQSAHHPSNSCIVIKIIQVSNKCSTSHNNRNSNILHRHTRTTRWIMDIQLGSRASNKSSQWGQWITTLHPTSSTTISSNHPLVEASILFCHLVGLSQLVPQAAKANSHIIKPCLLPQITISVIMRQMAWGNHNSLTLVRCSSNSQTKTTATISCSSSHMPCPHLWHTNKEVFRLLKEAKKVNFNSIKHYMRAKLQLDYEHRTAKISLSIWISRLHCTLHRVLISSRP